MARGKGNGAGRPSLYKEEYPKQARKLGLLGATDKEIADFFEVSEDTIYEWKKAHPEFSEALKEGKAQADAEVANRLYKRAMGYSHKAVKIFMPAGANEPVYAPYVERYPPDTTAAIFWLKNRQPEKWRDKHDVEVSGDGLTALLEQARRRAIEREEERPN
jgi:hypothetical protein